MRIGKHSVVSIDYTLTGADGEVLDSSKGREPLAYIQGTGSIVIGLEEALEGKEKGASVQVSVPPAKGYGERQEARVEQRGILRALRVNKHIEDQQAEDYQR